MIRRLLAHIGREYLTCTVLPRCAYCHRPVSRYNPAKLTPGLMVAGCSMCS